MTTRRRAEGRSKVSADNYFAMVPEWVLFVRWFNRRFPLTIGRGGIGG